MVKIFGNFGAAKWMLAIIASVIALVILARTHLLDRFSEFFRGLGFEMRQFPFTARIVERAIPIIEDIGGTTVETGRQMGLFIERIPVINGLFGRLMMLLAPVADLVGEFFQFLAAPLRLNKNALNDAQGWRVLFCVSAVLGAVGAILGFYRSNFPRKYEFQSRDYSMEKRLFGQRQG